MKLFCNLLALVKHVYSWILCQVSTFSVSKRQYKFQENPATTATTAACHGQRRERRWRKDADGSASVSEPRRFSLPFSIFHLHALLTRNSSSCELRNAEIVCVRERSMKQEMRGVNECETERYRCVGVCSCQVNFTLDASHSDVHPIATKLFEERGAIKKATTTRPI